MSKINTPYQGKAYKEMVKLYGKKKATQMMKKDLKANLRNLRRSDYNNPIEPDYYNQEVLESLGIFKKEFDELKREERERTQQGGSRGRILNEIWNSVY
jgi:hypothetical protein